MGPDELVDLEVDEHLGFTQMGVHDIAGCEAALASLVPHAVDGVHVVAAGVDEPDASAEPARATTTGRARLRADLVKDHLARGRGREGFTLRTMPGEEELFRTGLTLGLERSTTLPPGGPGAPRRGSAPVHRDLGPWVTGTGITLDATTLTIAHHSGLHHLSVERLSIREAVRTDNLQRHALLELRTNPSTSVREMARALGVRAGAARRAMERLVDAGAAVAGRAGDDRRYATGEAVSARPGPRPPARPAPRAPRPAPLEMLTRNGPAILDALAAGPASLPDLTGRTGLSEGQLHHALSDLRRRGLVVLDGGRGQRTSTYRLSRADRPAWPNPAAPRSDREAGARFWCLAQG